MKPLMLATLIAGALLVAALIHVQQRGGTIDINVDEERVKPLAAQPLEEGQATARHASRHDTKHTR
jgi:hypothetical protein